MTHRENIIADLVDVAMELRIKENKLASLVNSLACQIKTFWKDTQESNKPSWDSAPEWAQWLAQDANGGWYWYKTNPVASSIFPTYNIAGDFERAFVQPNWVDTLEQRPTPALKPCPFCGKTGERAGITVSCPNCGYSVCWRVWESRA